MKLEFRDYELELIYDGLYVLKDVPGVPKDDIEQLMTYVDINRA